MFILCTSLNRAIARCMLPLSRSAACIVRCDCSSLALRRLWLSLFAAFVYYPVNYFRKIADIKKAIEESKNCYLENFISALGIPLIGLNVAKEIVKYYPTWSDFRDAVGGKWSDLEGFGPEMEKAINNFDYVEADKIAAILTFKKHEVQVKDSSANAAAGLNFVITGKLSKPRNQIQKDILGWNGTY